MVWGKLHIFSQPLYRLGLSCRVFVGLCENASSWFLVWGLPYQTATLY